MRTENTPEFDDLEKNFCNEGADNSTPILDMDWKKKSNPFGFLWLATKK